MKCLSCTASQKYKSNFGFTAYNRYGIKFINYDLFLQQTVRNYEIHIDALQAQIEHLYDLVEVSETLKIIGNDLIKMSDQLFCKNLQYSEYKNDLLILDFHELPDTLIRSQLRTSQLAKTPTNYM